MGDGALVFEALVFGVLVFGVLVFGVLVFGVLAVPKWTGTLASATGVRLPSDENRGSADFESGVGSPWMCFVGIGEVVF